MTAWNAEQSSDFRGPLDVNRAATAVVDAQDTVIGWSPAAERLLGYKAQEILGRPVATLLPPGQAAAVLPPPPCSGGTRSASPGTGTGMS